MKNEIYRKNGMLSAYGLSCGYVHKYKNFQIYMEHGVYIVQYALEEQLYRKGFDRYKDTIKYFKSKIKEHDV